MVFVLMLFSLTTSVLAMLVREHSLRQSFLGS